MSKKEIKKFWKLDELVTKAGGQIPMPKDPKDFSPKNLLAFPHWALFSSIHVGKFVSENVIINNLFVIKKLPTDVAANTRIKDLMKMGVKL